MKKWRYICFGILIGIMISIMFECLLSMKGISSIKGVHLLDKYSIVEDVTSFEVKEVIANNCALVVGGWHSNWFLLTNDDDHLYYDGERVELPNGMVVKQIGTYQYKVKGGNRTERVIKFFKK